MLKKILFSVISFFVLFAFYSCGTQSEPSETVASDITLSQALNEIKCSVELPPMFELSEADIVDYFGIDSSMYTDYSVSICENSLQKDQIVIFKATDKESSDIIAEKLNTVRQAALDETENYLPDQYAIVSQCNVEVIGDFVTLFISENADEITEAFKNAIN